MGKVKVENIYWVIPNDVWMISREGGGTPWSKAEAILEFDGDEEKAMQVLEERKVFVRLDPNIAPPTRFRFPVIGKKELHFMRKIKNIIRKGRVSAMHLTTSPRDGVSKHVTVHFEGDHPHEVFGPADDFVFVHCTSPGPFNGVDIKELFVSEEQLDLYLLYAPPIPISMSVLGYLEAARKKKTLDLKLGEKLLNVTKGEDPRDVFESEEKKEEKYVFSRSDTETSSNLSVKANDILKAVVLPLKVKEQNGNFGSLVNLAVFLAIADTDPMVPYNWMKGNRLSLLSIPLFKCGVYENLDKMVTKGSILGFSNENIEMFRILRDKLEPLRGK